MVVADTEAHARAGARLVVVEYEDLPAVLSNMEAAVTDGVLYEVRNTGIDEVSLDLPDCGAF